MRLAQFLVLAHVFVSRLVKLWIFDSTGIVLFEWAVVEMVSFVGLDCCCHREGSLFGQCGWGRGDPSRRFLFRSQCHVPAGSRACRVPAPHAALFAAATSAHAAPASAVAARLADRARKVRGSLVSAAPD